VSGTEELTRWLGEQFDKDEQIARGCSGTEWREHPKNWVSAPPNRVALVVHDGDRTHILRHDPARVLREIDSKRQLLNDHPIVPRSIEPVSVGGEEIGGPYYPFGCGNCHADPETGEVNGFGYCPTWRVIATVYTDRPGYRAEEWAP
jgi:hypothetical protein